MVYFGSFGNNNIYLGGNTNTGTTPQSDFGMFGVKYRACSCMCLFCTHSFCMQCAVYTFLASIPRVKSSYAGLSCNYNAGSYRNNDRNFGVNLSKGLTGTSGVRYTSPFSTSDASTTYMYNNTSLSNVQNYVGVAATMSSGYSFAGWRINSTSGTVATTVNATNFYYNSTYGGTSFLYINWLYSSATAASSAPTVTTGTVTFDSTNDEIDMGGNVTSDGGASITARGFVGSTSTNPTTSSNVFNKSVSGTTGLYSASQDTGALLVGPNGTTYYVRAYATNSVGTSYGSNKSVLVTASGGGWNP